MKNNRGAESHEGHSKLRKASLSSIKSTPGWANDPLPATWLSSLSMARHGGGQSSDAAAHHGAHTPPSHPFSSRWRRTAASIDLCAAFREKIPGALLPDSAVHGGSYIPRTVVMNETSALWTCPWQGRRCSAVLTVIHPQRDSDVTTNSPYSAWF